MRAVIERFLEALRDEECYCEEEQEWQFRDGSACGICTSSAFQVAGRFGGVVVGYHSTENPDALIGKPDYDGHDFALVNDRWIVDYWAWHVAGLVTMPIFDLKDRSDHDAICRLYGDAGLWTLVHSFIEHGQERQLDSRATYPRLQSVQPDPIWNYQYGQPQVAGVSEASWTLRWRRVL